MEESAAQTKEEHEARDAVSLDLARAHRTATQGATEVDDNRPPHMRG